jgi:hypothetical protein
MLYRIPFESFDWFMVKCPYYNFFVKVQCKGMHKMMQSNSKKLYIKSMFSFMQLHVHYVNLIKISKSWKFEATTTNEMIPLLNNLVTVLYPLGSKNLALDAHYMCKK